MVEVKRFQQSFLNEYMATKLFETDFFNRGKDEGLEIGLEKGREEGLEEGKQESRLETAKNFLAMGLPIETVMQGTGLSKEEIEPLLS